MCLWGDRVGWIWHNQSRDLDGRYQQTRWPRHSVQLHLRVTPKVYKLLRLAVQREECSMSDYVTAALLARWQQRAGPVEIITPTRYAGGPEEPEEGA